MKKLFIILLFVQATSFATVDSYLKFHFPSMNLYGARACIDTVGVSIDPYGNDESRISMQLQSMFAPYVVRTQFNTFSGQKVLDINRLSKYEETINYSFEIDFGNSERKITISLDFSGIANLSEYEEKLIYYSTISNILIYSKKVYIRTKSSKYLPEITKWPFTKSSSLLVELKLFLVKDMMPDGCPQMKF